MEIGYQKINWRAYISKFAFSGPAQNKKVGVLSGGERNRLHLALTLKTEANVLLLDEPTNDIDINTLRALEEGIIFFFQAEDGIRDGRVTGVQTCALPICNIFANCCIKIKIISFK